MSISCKYRIVRRTFSEAGILNEISIEYNPIEMNVDMELPRYLETRLIQ